MKPIPNAFIENSEEEQNKSIEKLILKIIKNSKPKDYVDARVSLNKIKAKSGF